MAYIAVIVGLSERERYLRRPGEVEDVRKATRFRSLQSAEVAAKQHIGTFPPVIRRGVRFRVEPRA